MVLSVSLAVAAPADEVVGPFGIDGIAGDLDDANIETGSHQCPAQDGHQISVADAAQSRLGRDPG